MGVAGCIISGRRTVSRMRIEELLLACIIFNVQLALVVLTDMPLCAVMTGKFRDSAAASAVRRIPSRAIEQEQVDRSFRVLLGAAFPAGSCAVQP